MCIYTDRKPKAHKLISPAVAEALQSENLTLKKAMVVIFKALVEARDGGELPAIDGVEWDSDKVANGKSGRALNYIITKEARVDNRISNDEICSYDSDTVGLQCPDSPASQPSTPAAGWLLDTETTTSEPAPVSSSSKKRKSAQYGYSHSNCSSIDMGVTSHIATPTFIDPNLLQPAGGYPPTPPTTGLEQDYLPPVTAAAWTNSPTTGYDMMPYGPAEQERNAAVMQWRATQNHLYQMQMYMADAAGCTDEEKFSRVYATAAYDPSASPQQM